MNYHTERVRIRDTGEGTHPHLPLSLNLSLSFSFPLSLSLSISFYPTLAIPSQTHLYPSLPISPYPSPQAYRTTSPKWLRLLGMPGRGYCRNTPETTETVLVGS